MKYFELANELYNKKNYLEAIDMYKKSVVLNENEAASLYNAAVCYIKLKDFTNALFLLKQAVSIKTDSKYYFNIGYCYSMLNDNKKALIYFNMSWSLNNNDADCKKAISLILNNYNKKGLGH